MAMTKHFIGQPSVIAHLYYWAYCIHVCDKENSGFASNAYISVYYQDVENAVAEWLRFKKEKKIKTPDATMSIDILSKHLYE